MARSLTKMTHLPTCVRFYSQRGVSARQIRHKMITFGHVEHVGSWSFQGPRCGCGTMRFLTAEMVRRSPFASILRTFSMVAEFRL